MHCGQRLYSTSLCYWRIIKVLCCVLESRQKQQQSWTMTHRRQEDTGTTNFLLEQWGNMDYIEDSWVKIKTGHKAIRGVCLWATVGKLTDLEATVKVWNRPSAPRPWQTVNSWVNNAPSMYRSYISGNVCVCFYICTDFGSKATTLKWCTAFNFNRFFFFFKYF